MGIGTLFFGFVNTPIDFFAAEVTVVNQSNATLFITPITTTYTEPEVIAQIKRWHHKDIPLQAGDVLTLSYDTADHSLDGIVICDENDSCGLLENTGQSQFAISNLNTLPPVDETWTAAIDAAPAYNFQVLIMTGFALTPFALFTLWWWLGKSNESEV